MLNDARMAAALETGDYSGLAMPAEDRDARVADTETAALLSAFESLGDGCEFGLLQRRYGLEPISLLRWSAISARGLIDLVKAGFEGLDDPSATLLHVVGGSLVLNNSRFEFGSNTQMAVGSEPLEKLHPKLLKRTRFLARKLADDLAAGEKIFVYKANRGIRDAEIAALSATIARAGPNRLVIVQLARPRDPAGSVRRHDPTTFPGFVRHFDNVDIDVPSWLEICRAVRAAGMEQAA